MIAALLFVLAAAVAAVCPWAWKRRFPTPEILPTATRKLSDDENSAQWEATIRLKRGLLFWINRLPGCRLYLIRLDWGLLTSRPEGIWLKWIESGTAISQLENSLVVGRVYHAIMVVRDAREGTAYVANERFIDTNGAEKKWSLKPERDYPPGDIGRYAFTLQVGKGNKRWHFKHYYAAHVPPAGVGNDEFQMDVLHEHHRA
jgi:hypothetical protein